MRYIEGTLSMKTIAWEDLRRSLRKIVREITTSNRVLRIIRGKGTIMRTNTNTCVKSYVYHCTIENSLELLIEAVDIDDALDIATEIAEIMFDDRKEVECKAV